MGRIRALHRAMLVIALLGTMSCERIAGPEGRVRLKIMPAAVELMVGDTAWLTATVYDDRGRVVSGAEVSWRRAPEDPANVYSVEVAAARERNRLSGAIPGTVQVIAESGGQADTVAVSVRGYSISLASVTAGSSALTCGLTPEGEAYCWGTQYSGPYPTGGESTSSTYAPARVPGGGVFASLVVGHQYACGLTHEGAAYCWGLGETGALGNGSKAYPPPGRLGSTAPIPVEGELRFASLVSGLFHTCGLTREGEAYCWGSDLYGQLGDGPSTDSCNGEPCRRVPVPVSGGLRFASLSLGGGHSCGITTRGETYCWGINNREQLGNPSALDVCRDSLSSHHCSTVPVPVIGGPEFHSLAVGIDHSCGLTAERAAYCWGSNAAGQLGDGRASLQSAAPVRVDGDLLFSSLDAGGATCGLTAAGRAYCWGPSGYRQTGTETIEKCVLGNTASDCNTRPVSVSGHLGFRSINAGGFHACGIALDGAPYCWGNNMGGSLGNGDGHIRRSASPLRVYGSG